MPTAQRSRKPKPAPTPAAPTTWMVATINPPGEPRLFLSGDNFHHDRPDVAPTAVTFDPRESPAFASPESAGRAVARFPVAGATWAICPDGSALMNPSVILAMLAAAGLPGKHLPWRLETEVGTFAVEPGPAGPAKCFRVTYGPEDCRSSVLHAVHNVLERCYRVEFESLQHPTHVEQLAVRVVGVRPRAEWFRPHRWS